MNARDLIYSTTDEEMGPQCGKVQTVFFKLPGKQAAGPAGWQIRGKLTLYVWLGIVKHKKFFFSGLPRGFELSQDLRNAERPRAMAPTNIHYLEKYVSFTFLEPQITLIHSLSRSTDLPATSARLSGSLSYRL